MLYEYLYATVTVLPFSYLYCTYFGHTVYAAKSNFCIRIYRYTFCTESTTNSSLIETDANRFKSLQIDSNLFKSAKIESCRFFCTKIIKVKSVKAQKNIPVCKYEYNRFSGITKLPPNTCIPLNLEFQKRLQNIKKLY